ncbi:uncharacterized protein LY89DRAFT_492938 [Mollisia scopiformis]|uniref:Transcription factor Iwr1 domain-containing protein n=1 Tax=Mollisia scopiformis TaxID=149040 RepID=A0A194XIC2_MOLSC|nr:uncharacterized protein LY89DRAFT_492938 [Mollisia scopiformis]KUJ19517.1 hypothetical protein LY89DRAFT_492938 [Mollisia scopiformis]
MSLPPVIVQIKRKATDEPVDLLRVHELDNPRKKRATEYVFSLQSIPDIQPTPPAVRKIKELHRSASSQALGTSSPISRPDIPASQNLPQSNAQVGDPAIQSTPPTTPGTPNSSANALQQFKSTQPRHFHISRSSTPSLADSVGGPSRKRKAEPTIFIERRSRPKSRDGQSPNNNGTPIQSTPAETPRPQKKPGLAARSSTPPVRAPVPKPAVAPLRNVRLPSGEVIPWDVSSERLAAEMQAYTLAEIGRNIAASQAPTQEPTYTSSHIHKSAPSKFKPKAPALRYAQRHPEEKSQADQNMMMNLDGPYIEDEADDDAEYIIDTYIRMSADALETEAMPKNIGFLILGSQPDIDEFYREEEDSDEEEDDLDEDENAENHYTADYPDEEVDSDDEFDRNAYHYRTHNASDLEEFDGADDEDMTFSDDENESTKYPWMKKKPWLTNPKTEMAGDEDEDE